MDKLCEAKLCTRPAKFSLRDIKTGRWLHLCGFHDNFYGIRNLELQGVEHSEAIAINKSVKLFEANTP